MNPTSAQGVTVVATVSKPFVPDVSVFSIILVTEGKTAAEATAGAAAARTRLLATFRKAGVSDDAIQSTDLELRNNSALMFGGTAKNAAPWLVQEGVNARASVDRTGVDSDALIANGFGKLLTVTFDTSKRDELYRAALAQAMQRAQDTATQIALSAHVEILKLQSVDAGPTADILHAEQVALAKLQSGNAFGLFNGTQQQQTVTATVLATFRGDALYHERSVP